MDEIRVLVTDPLEKEGIVILEKAGFRVDQVGKQTPEQLCAIIGNYDVVVVRSATKIPADVIRTGRRLKIIGRAGVGLDNVDLKEATACGVIVMNSPDGNTISAAEHTVGMLLSLVRNIAGADASVKKGQWEKKKFMGTEVYGKVLGILGLGRIGRRVAACARGLGMKVLGYDPLISEEDARALDIGLISLDGILKQSDFITLHLPLTEETRHLLGEKQFAMMKDGVRVINVARGGVIDEAALVAAIKAKKVRGAALDVFEKEPPEGNPLLGLEEVILTPHLGASTMEAQVNVATELARQIVDALTRKVIRNAANLPALSEEAMGKLWGFLSLGEKLGIFLKQVVDGPLEEVRIEYGGEIVNYDLSLLRNAVLKGVLTGHERVNLVNAALVLKQQNIDLKEKRLENAGEFSNLVTVALKGKTTASIAGTLVLNGDERIVRIDGFSVEATPAGYLLLCHNDDKPGIMGHLGMVLGARKVNIASMTLGRKKKGGAAITILNLDETIDDETISTIREFPAIHSAKLVRL